VEGGKYQKISSKVKKKGGRGKKKASKKWGKIYHYQKGGEMLGSEQL